MVHFSEKYISPLRFQIALAFKRVVAELEINERIKWKSLKVRELIKVLGRASVLFGIVSTHDTNI